MCRFISGRGHVAAKKKLNTVNRLLKVGAPTPRFNLCKTPATSANTARAVSSLSRSADLHSPKMLQVARMSGLVKLRCSGGHLGERQLWAENDHGLQDCGAPAQDIPQRRGC